MRNARLDPFIAQNPQAWIDASRVFAEKALGEIHAFVGGARSNSVWSTIELPALLQNSRVDKIIIHDAVRTEITRIIYPARVK